MAMKFNQQVRRSLGLVSMATIGLAQPASGQTAPADGVAAAVEDPTAKQGSDIVVTARKRNEQLIDVPIAAQAFSGASLEAARIDNSQDLVGTVPSLSFSSNLLSPGRDFLNLVIRGVGSQSAGSPAVATFVDGVYVPSLSFDMGFLDAERIEVLQGPQGTLFGRNAEGGALSIVLRRPDASFRAKAAVSFDEFNTARGQATVSGPLSDTVSGLIAGDIERSDGFLRNPVVAAQAGGDTGSSVSADRYSRYSGRAAIRFRPRDGLDINLAMDGSSRTGLSGLPGVPRGLHDYVVRSDFQIDGKAVNYGAALNIDAELGSVKLSSITGYRRLTSTLPFDFDGSPEYGPNFQDLRTQQRILSQELRLSGHAGSTIDWLAGLYGFSETHAEQRLIRLGDIQAFGGPGLFVNAQNQTLESSGAAGFVDVTWRIIPRVELDVGVRYAYEKVKSNVVLDYSIPGILTVKQSGRDSLSNKNFIPSASLKYNFTPTLMAYLRFAQGYRAGGFPLAPASATTNISFRPEKTDNYEAGFKGRVFGGALDFALSAFLIDIKDQQLSTIVFLNNDPRLPVASVGNAGRSRSKGFALTANARPARGIELGANVGYTDARYRSYFDTAGVDRSGERFPFVPRWTQQYSATFTQPIAADTQVQLAGTYKYVGRTLSGSGVDIDLQFPVKAYELIGLRASLIKPRWKLDLFVDNVANKFIETRVFNAFFFATPRPFSEVLPPRRIGAKLTVNFGR